MSNRSSQRRARHARLSRAEQFADEQNSRTESEFAINIGGGVGFLIGAVLGCVLPIFALTILCDSTNWEIPSGSIRKSLAIIGLPIVFSCAFAGQVAWTRIFNRQFEKAA